MFKHVTFYSAITILLLVGKIGHIGTLATLTWWQVAIPVVVELLHNCVLGYLIARGTFEKGAWQVQNFFINMAINRKAKKFASELLNKQKKGGKI